MTSEDKKAILDDDEGDETRKKCCPSVNRTLLVPKGFYFFFFSAWGSLLPYLALYFKQLMLSPSEVGILMGLKPFVNFLVIPIWGAIVDKCHKSKLVLVISMIALITTTFSLSLVPAPKEKKVIVKRMCSISNGTNKFVEPNFVHRPVMDNPDYELTGEPEIDKMVDMDKSRYLPYFYKGPSPWPLELITQFSIDEDEEHTKFDTTPAFITLFLITFFGTLFSSPTLALVDTATIQLLGKETYKYGMQRLTGSIGWGIGAFVVGASLKTTHKCSNDISYEIVDYIPCFYTFAVLMFLGLVVATRYKFDESAQTSHGGSLRVGLRALKNPKYIMFLFTALYLGFLMAFIKTFLFWHLKDLGGTQLLFSIISAVNCFAEVSMYFLSAKLIKKIGHAKVLYLGLICYSIRLFYYSAIPIPWLVLVVELLPGITTAAVWAACLSYVSLNSGPGAATTMQCILHGVHWGLGYGAGEVIGGVMVHHYGAPFTFVFFGCFCIIVLAMYMLINNFCGSSDDNSDSQGCKEVSQAESEESDIEK
ncbi:major facilitator superfamily domain-containing protein 6 [Nematostella vectensis]|uniref:major facilitator superfamily domain-containing protein 6 n=1 Tax=Nematostella vectensis TaxID=45351 RepID=UPI00138FC3AD|nr:major facilitator superfamily domain-containing protein 6 [Nematostella vectensis]